MATPAAHYDRKSYTAGSCRLEVTAKYSALSQWSERPIIQSLSFQLWLADVADGQIPEMAMLADTCQLQLIAEGDRTELQSLVRYIQRKTRRVLAVATFGVPHNLASAKPEPPENSPPQSLQLPQPLTYLQLCDLASVLGQYEHSSQPLPVSLAVTPPTAERSDNVVSLPRVRPRSRSATSRPVAAGRRRNRVGLWASSAAAALFAVGLTTNLWSRDERLQQTAVEPAVPESAVELESLPRGSVLEESAQIAAEPDISVSEESVSGAGSSGAGSSGAGNIEATDRVQPDDPSTEIENANGADFPIAENIRPNSALPSQPGTVQSREPASTVPSDIGVDGGAIADADGEENTPVVSPTPESASPEAAEGAFDADIAPAEDFASSARPSSAARRSDRFSTAPSVSQAPTTASSLESTAESAADAERTVVAPSAPHGLSGTVEAVRVYFQQRWPANGQRPDEGPLQYRLQLSATGEVVSFAALNDASQRYRDRILPTDNPPTFAVATRAVTPPDEVAQENVETAIAAAPVIALQVILNPDGLIQVSPL